MSPNLPIPRPRIAAALVFSWLLLAGAASAQPATRPTTQPDTQVALPADRAAWDDRPELSLPRHPWEAALEGKIIALDPGHGGDAHREGYKRGPTGVREAEMNLRVGLYLRDLLQAAGATVVMTRTDDVDSTLAQRAAVANDAKADVFVSLHHNAVGNPETNYTTVWHHGRPADAGPSLDLARYLAVEIGEALRTQVGKTSPVMSDLQMYDSGFGVLRPATMPAVLTESSFYTNPEEEQRLAEPEYNLREAYAIYRGLCAYFRHGTPTQAVERDGPVLRVRLDDGLPEWWGHELRGPMPHTIDLRGGDGRRLDFEYDPNARALVALLPAGTTQVTLRHQNAFRHENWPQRIDLADIAAPATRPAVAAAADPPATRPATRPAVANDRAMDEDPAPWAKLPDIAFPVELPDAGTSGALDHGLDLPAGSALTVARVDPATGELSAVRYDRTGESGFYPASTVKLTTANVLVQQLRELGITVLHDVEVGEGPRQNVGKLLADMIKVSDNDAFNDLAEVVGFREMRAAMDEWGALGSTIRRHFKRPRSNNSPEIRFYDPEGDLVRTLKPRPGVDMPLNTAGGESNRFTTDDLVRVLAATFQGPARDAPAFGILASAMRDTNERYVGRGLDRAGGRYVSYDKPGWWPPDGNNVDMAYVYDTKTNQHYYVGAYFQGNYEDAQTGMADAAERLFQMIDEGKITFE